MKKLFASPADEEAAPNAGRRFILGGLLASYVVSFMGVAEVRAASDATSAGSVTNETSSSAFAAFVSVSELLTGRATLDNHQAQRLYSALALAYAASFNAQLGQLAGFIAEHGCTADNLQSLLDAAHAPFASLAASIATAWYVGVAGTGVAARCVTYEASLMNVVVADRLKPPSYAYGPYGSWGINPVNA
jgi:hypothetical protein